MRKSANEAVTILNNQVLDDTSFEKLFKEYFSLLSAYCQFKFNIDVDSAKESTHTAFIKLWEVRHTLSPQVSVVSYLYKIATNICIDMLRHEKVKRSHVKYVLENNAEITEGWLNPLELKNLTEDIELAVAELPTQMRKIFELSRYEKLKYSEISQELNISVKTVETQMSRALMKLRKKLAEYLTSILALTFLFS